MSSSSRWGSFLQQAVAGVESRLDNILGETDEFGQPLKTGTATPPAAAQPPKVADNAAPKKTPVSNPANDRLQERLARAVAAKKHAAAALNTPSRTGSPAIISESPRSSLDITALSTPDQVPESNKVVPASEPADNDTGDGLSSVALDATSASIKDEVPIKGISARVESESTPRVSIESPSTSNPRLSTESIRSTVPSSTIPEASVDTGLLSTASGLVFSSKSSDVSSTSRQPSGEIDRSDHERQQEIHEYIERIDALQAKLQYLSREAAEAGRKAAAAAPSGSAEKKMAEKDEQIALLMEEGQKLSKKELQHMTLIKRLRAKAVESEKEATEAKKRVEKLDKDKLSFAEKLRRSDAAERLANEKQKALGQAQKDLEAMTNDRDSKTAAINQLKLQLKEAASQAKADEVKAIQASWENEKKRASDLENDLSSLKIEKELAAGRAKAQFDELKAKGEREAERARVLEVEMKAEQQMLEGRLEVLRTRAEDLSSGATGDAQAKLLRQIETLQSQYAIASENWQRIEASLSARATNLEKEKDEALKREAETRRKAREMNLKSKRIEEEVEELRTKSADLQLENSEQKDAVTKLVQRAEDAEKALSKAKAAFDEEKQAWSANLDHRMDEAKSQWREETSGNSTYANSRAESPVATTHRSLTAEYLGLQNLQARRASSRSTPVDPLSSRRPSAQIGKIGSVRGTVASPRRQDSQQSLFTNGEGNESPNALAMDQDDYFESLVTPSSPHDKMNDMVSVSTIGAGPSVQLVERMSAAVRRLEAEKVSTKEEMARLSAQRDEARAEIVTLMSEIENRKSLEVRMHNLEEENTKINARYQTTLEMLGEKSELVEELKADVQDVKDMYRELVERTIK